MARIRVGVTAQSEGPRAPVTRDPERGPRLWIIKELSFYYELLFRPILLLNLNYVVSILFAVRQFILMITNLLFLFLYLIIYNKKSLYCNRLL